MLMGGESWHAIKDILTWFSSSGTLGLVLTDGGYSNEFNCVRYHKPRLHGTFKPVQDPD